MNNNLITGVLAGVSGVLSYIFGPWDAMIMAVSYTHLTLPTN